MHSILLCTNNVIPKKLFEAVIKCAYEQACMTEDTNVVVVSQYPVFVDNIFIDIPDTRKPQSSNHSRLDCIKIKEAFLSQKDMNICPIVNLVIGEKAYAVDTIYRQILSGLEYCNDYVLVFEHDVLYPYNYADKAFGALKEGKDICFWEDAIYLSYQGYFTMQNCFMFNRFSFSKSFLQKHIQGKIERNKTSIEPALKGYFLTEPNEPEYENYAILKGTDILDIKHGFNVGGYSLVDDYMERHPYWGHKDEFLTLIDEDYRNATQKNLSCFYGFGED